MSTICLVLNLFLCSACPISSLLGKAFASRVQKSFDAPLKAIYFDFGGVMARPDAQMQLDFLVNKVGFPEEAVQNSPYFCWMQLHLFEVEYLTQMAEEYQVSLPLDFWEQYRKIKRSSVHEIPGMAEIIKSLRDLNYKTYLMSNISSENLDLIEPFISQFDGFIHCPKDPGERKEIWEIEWMRQGLNPSEIILIDDQKPNLDEARNLGIRAIQFQNVEILLKELIDPLRDSKVASPDR